MDLEEYLASFGSAKTQRAVFEVLRDRSWHCRGCGYRGVQTGQLAGSGGIKGLKNGAPGRYGIRIESKNIYCSTCDSIRRHDRWTGEFNESTPYGSMPPAVADRIFGILGHRDVIEQATRAPHQLTIDHKLPRVRWTPEENRRQTDYSSLTDADICERFQILKKADGVNHNLLKSRACEDCKQTGERGTPMGISYFYQGDHRWRGVSPTDPSGCIGCGWFDFAEWRRHLNAQLNAR